MTTATRPEAPGTAFAGDGPASDPLAALVDFVTLRRVVGLYPDGHPLVIERLRDTDAAIQSHLQDASSLSLDVVNGNIHVDGVPVHDETRAHANAMAELAGIGIGSVEILRGITADEMRTAALFLWRFDGKPGGEPVAAQLKALGVRHVRLARVVPLDTSWSAPKWPDSPTTALDPDYEEALVRTHEAFDRAASGRGIDATTVHETVQLLVHRVARSSAAVGHVVTVKQYENLTYCHSVNVAVLSLLIGRQVGLDGPTMNALVEAALLHDIGKTRVPLEVVAKPGALDHHERRLIEAHAALGGEILASTEGLGPLTPTVALEHHRTITGGGYPELGPEAIPHAMSQIVSVADIYEALTGARSYKEPTPPERACAILARIAGEKLNPALVKAFVSTITFFPVGSFVRTSLDETAVVIRTNPADPIRPVLAILAGDCRAVVAEVDLVDRSGAGTGQRHIVETVAPPEHAPDLSTILGSVERPRESL